MTTIGVFLLLAGGTAIAAKGLAKNSVGPKQLKSNAVTTAKIKKGAVTKAKLGKNAVTAEALADGSVTGAKLADGSVSGAKIAAGSTNFSQRIARLTSSAVVSMKALEVYPVGSYTQGAGEDSQIISALDVRFGAGCVAPRTAVALLTMDAVDPKSPQPEEIVGFLFGHDTNSGETTRRFDFAPYPAGLSSSSIDGPAAATPHRFDIVLQGGTCEAGEGIDAVGAIVDVIGTK
jgi:hypothetical protein